MRQRGSKGVESTVPPSTVLDSGIDEEGSTEDDDDLDAPSQSQGLSQKPIHTRRPQRSRQRTKSPSLPASAEPATSPPPASRPKAKGFRIGGKAKTEAPELPQSEDKAVAQEDEPTQVSMPLPSQIDSQMEASPKKPRKAFKIGGKNKASQDIVSSQRDVTISPATQRFRDAYSPTPKSSPPLMPQDTQKEPTLVEVTREETSEEKAERKRAELKRRNEEIAKKQAQQKKKKRF